MKARLAGHGEDRLVGELVALLPGRADVVVGAGDDCAVIDAGWRGEYLLWKTDAVVEGVHFVPGERGRLVGWKAMARCLSDIAAMGGRPEHALVSVVARGDLAVAYLRDVYRGLSAAARRAGVAVVGGETSRSDGPLVLSVALSGRVSKARCALRGGGRAGDLLYVTGRLGGAGAGRHLRFWPRLDEGAWLVGRYRIRAMMDLSDGLAKDLPRLAAAARLDYEIDAGAVPRRRGCSLREAIGDGEDYELLFAVAPGTGPRLERAWRGRFPGVSLTRIGHLTAAERGAGRLEGGYDHFS